MHRKNHRSRGGWSLIETAVLMMATSAILSVVTVVSYGLLRLQSTTRKYDDARLAVRRLETMLRTDAHAAAQATLQDAPAAKPAADEAQPVLLFQSAAEAISYQRVQRRIERRVRRDNKEIRREAFLLPHGLSLSWKLSSTGGVDYISADFERDAVAENQSLPRYAWRISAVVGLDQQRLEQNRTAP